jgi:hypothetical protein
MPVKIQAEITEFNSLKRCFKALNFGHGKEIFGSYFLEGNLKYIIINK